MIHSLKLAQTDAFQLYARESVFSLRQAQFFFEDFSSLPLRGYAGGLAPLGDL